MIVQQLFGIVFHSCITSDMKMDLFLCKRLLVYYEIGSLFPITLFATTVVAIDLGTVTFTETSFLLKQKLFNLIRLECKVTLHEKLIFSI